MDRFLTSFALVVSFVLYLPYSHQANLVFSECDRNAAMCKIDLHVAPRVAMVTYHDDFMAPVAVSSNGTVRVVDSRTCEQSYVMSEQDFANVITGDGSYKMLTVFNNSLPGPPIVVYKGQQVVVRVHNQMVNDGLTLHFHGLHQRNTPWMDGAGGVSQCPINPGERFTYRFLADEAGTYWYHSHHGMQRTMGAYGPFVVLNKDKQEEDIARGADILPEFAGEFHFLVSDYMHADSTEILLRVKHEAVSFSYGYDVTPEECFNSTKQADGVDCGVTPFNSAVINGKGRHYPNRDDQATIPTLPLETFHVKKGNKYRFRAVCTSMTFGFRISIDNHTLHVIASDSRDIVTQTAQSAILFPGERMDFWIEATDSEQLGLYWIRAENLEFYQNNKRINPGVVYGKLHYGEGAVLEDPISTCAQCTTQIPCTVLNCPFQSFPASENLTCIHMSDLRSTSDKPVVQPEANQQLHEIFLNFHFAHNNHMWKTSINGIQHVPPAAPPQVHPSSWQQYITPCDEAHCTEGKAYCACTHQLDIPLGAVVQLVLSTTIRNPVGVLNGNSHQIHLHGTHFQVLKTAYPTYTEEQMYKEQNQDFMCMDEWCNKLLWQNSSWANGGKIPGIVEQAPVEKDTINVPVGGYTIIRFKADNPGFWFMHCHTEFHSEEGMAMYLKVGNVSDMNPPPANMATCGEFDWSDEEFQNKITKRSDVKTESLLAPAADADIVPCEGAVIDVTRYQVACVIFASSTISLLGTVCLMYMKMRPHRSGYKLVESLSDTTSTDSQYHSGAYRESQNSGANHNKPYQADFSNVKYFKNTRKASRLKHASSAFDTA